MCLLGPPLISISTILLSSLFYILGPVHYLLFTIQSLTPVFWFCIFYILVLYLLSLNMCLLGPQLISISTIHLSSLFYILCPIHYLLFMYLSIFNSIIYQFSFLHVSLFSVWSVLPTFPGILGISRLTFLKKNPSRANGRSTYIHPPSLAKIRQRTSEYIGNKQTNTQTNKRCSNYSMIWTLFSLKYPYGG